MHFVIGLYMVEKVMNSLINDSPTVRSAGSCPLPRNILVTPLWVITARVSISLGAILTIGSDNLSARLLHFSSDVIAAPLTHLFAMSISTCSVPAKWKSANVAPLPKCRNPSLDDFRPVSLLPISSKLLEQLVLDSVKTELVSLYGDNQYGFRPGSSALNAHIAIHDCITRYLDSPSCDGVAMIALDLSKAFDRLSHKSILSTLSQGNLPHRFLLWIQDFLSECTQKVTFQGTVSSNEVRVTSGVPQGSVLAPYLFAASVGSLKPVFPQTVLVKYADDLTLLIPH